MSAFPSFLASFRFQFWLFRHGLDELQALILTPLYTVVFVGLALSAGRRDLVPGATLGAVLVCLWILHNQIGGNIIDMARQDGTFESLSATPTPLRGVVFGRVSGIVAIGLVLAPEAWLTTELVFGVAVQVPHPGLFALSLLLTLAGLAATANLVAAVFVLARAAIVFQNALTYPLFVLGGLVVPVSFLPGWLQPFAKPIFLAWGSDLLRMSLSPHAADPGDAIVWLVTTVAAMFVAGQLALTAMIDRSRRLGSMSYA